MMSASNAAVIVLVMEPTSTKIGSGLSAIFNGGRSDACAGPVALEALLERGTQFVFAGCHRRR